MTESVRKQKSGDQLTVGNWLAPGELLVGAAEVLFAHAYPASADRSRDNGGKHVQLVVREQGMTVPVPDVVAGNTLFDLASDEDLAVYREAALRRSLGEQLVTLANLIVDRKLPIPEHGLNITAYMGKAVNVQAVADALSLEVRPRGKNQGVSAEWPEGAKSYEQCVKVDFFTIADEPEDELAPESLTPAPIAAHYETSGWKGDGPGTCGIECACGVTYDGFDSLAEAKQQLGWHIADPSGQDYGRADTAEADDPTPVSPARVPMHTGTVTDDGLVEVAATSPADACPQCGHWQAGGWAGRHGPQGCGATGGTLKPCGCTYSEQSEDERCGTCGESLRDIARGTLGHIPGEICNPVDLDTNDESEAGR